MVEYVAEAKPAIIDQDGRAMVKIALIGIVLGLLVWGLTFVLEHYVLGAMLCRDEAAATCVNLVTYAGNISAVIVGIIGVVVLVRAQVFRPLLIALSVTVSLWGMAAWLAQLSLPEQMLWSVILSGLLYSLYAWLARIRNAVVVLVVFVLIVAATRLIPMFV